MALFNNPAFSCFIIVFDRQMGLKVADVIPFQFMPKTITDSKVAIYNDIAIVARSSPLKAYSQSQGRQISFTLDFFAAPQQGLELIIPSLIRNRIDALRALTYPSYSGTFTGVKPPPRCLVRIGNQVSMIGVCKQVTVAYNNEVTPWTIGALSMSFGASVTLMFEETLNIPLSNSEVRINDLPFSTAGDEFNLGAIASTFGIAASLVGSILNTGSAVQQLTNVAGVNPSIPSIPGLPPGLNF